MVNPSDLDWNSLTWSEAQHAIVEFLHTNGFMSFHERPIYKGRADGLVIKKTEATVTKMIVEVKHYNKVTDQVVVKAVNQGLMYLQTIIQEDRIVRSKSSKDYRYVLLVVFSKDYPVKQLSFKSLIDQSPSPLEIIYCSARNLEEILQKHDLIERQTGIDDFY